MSGLFDTPDGATPLDPDEIQGLKHRYLTTRGQLNELEQVNIEEGLLWLQRRRSLDPLCEDFVCELHRRLFGKVWEWAGRFRRTEKNIGVDPLQIGVQLRNLLDDARYWAENNTFHPLEAAARLHHRLVYIHLFANGNGRHARIMADIYLQYGFGEQPVDWSAGQDLLHSNLRREQYIAALRAADAGDYAPLLAFVEAGRVMENIS